VKACSKILNKTARVEIYVVVKILRGILFGKRNVSIIWQQINPYPANMENMVSS